MSEPEAYVWLHPGVKWGTPCVGGTRIPVDTIAQLVWGRGGSVQLARSSYPHLTREQVLVACWYTGLHSTTTWGRRWGAWATGHADAMWAGRWNDIPDPPNSGGNVQLALGKR